MIFLFWFADSNFLLSWQPCRNDGFVFIFERFLGLAWKIYVGIPVLQKFQENEKKSK